LGASRIMENGTFRLIQGDTFLLDELLRRTLEVVDGVVESPVEESDKLLVLLDGGLGGSKVLACRMVGE
jgi:hypothetical protein